MIHAHRLATCLAAAALPVAQIAFGEPAPISGCEGCVIDARYRYAHIDADGYADPANANTLRLSLGYLWRTASDWSAYAEGTRVFGLFGDAYNSGANGRSNLPAESDPPSQEISGLWLGYQNDGVQLRAGRQYINIDNQRFFTSGLWRQNPQSFDALSTAWRPFDGTTLRYVYLDEVQRSVGHDYPDPNQRAWSVEGHLLHADQDLPLGKLAGYGYFVENYTQSKYSWRTTGLRWAGSEGAGTARLSWTVESAEQYSWRNNPAHYTADYRLAELIYGWTPISLKFGDEVLGGNGRTAFSSPYGSNHGFNGWASEFKNDPANGLDDRYFGGTGKLTSRLNWNLTWHNFFAERGNLRYGSESDAGLQYAVSRDWSAEIDYASYHSNGFARSERKFWIALEYKRGPQGGD